MLNDEERGRYARHLMLPMFGMEGQLRLKRSSALLVGTGGLGSPAALYLAAAGVGHLGLVDFDVVDASNLQRQIAHASSTLGMRKTESASLRLHDLNPFIDITTHDVRLDASNALDVLRPYDVIIDGTDNFPTRYLTNDASVLLSKPLVYASIFRFEGQATVFAPHLGAPCYRCIYPTPPPPELVPNCAEAGVLGVLPGVLGTVQATEAIKLLAGIGEPLIGRLLLYDALAMQFSELRLRRDERCPLCGTAPTIDALIDYELFCGVPRAVEGDPSLLSPAAVAAWIAQPDRPLLLDVRELDEWDAAHLPDARRISVKVLAERLDELDPVQPVIVYCRSGARSARAAALLRDAGFTQVFDMAGGILAWATTVDTAMHPI